MKFSLIQFQIIITTCSPLKFLITNFFVPPLLSCVTFDVLLIPFVAELLTNEKFGLFCSGESSHIVEVITRLTNHRQDTLNHLCLSLYSQKPTMDQTKYAIVIKLN